MFKSKESQLNELKAQLNELEAKYKTAKSNGDKWFAELMEIKDEIDNKVEKLVKEKIEREVRLQPNYKSRADDEASRRVIAEAKYSAVMEALNLLNRGA